MGEVETELANVLSRRRRRIVFAESCTAGLVAATLAEVPGISDWLCGSAVTYRDDTKVQWLRVSQADIDQHTAVSKVVAKQMALGVLASTPESDVAASITGHLGPNAPAGFDGVVYAAIAVNEGRCGGVWENRLQSTTRKARQREAAQWLLRRVVEELEG